MEKEIRNPAVITTEIITFDCVPLVVPVFNGRPMDMPADNFDEFPSYCGAGGGLGDAVVPENIWGLCISPACAIHDMDFEIGPATWEAFHAANYRFLNNINSIIRHRSANRFIAAIRNYRAVTYFNAVDTVGAKVYWRIKREQGLV